MLCPRAFGPSDVPFRLTSATTRSRKSSMAWLPAALLASNISRSSIVAWFRSILNSYAPFSVSAGAFSVGVFSYGIGRLLIRMGALQEGAEPSELTPPCERRMGLQIADWTSSNLQSAKVDQGTRAFV